MKKVVQRIYVRINPETEKVQISCTHIDGYAEVYVGNYVASQAELKEEYNKQQSQDESES
jgi:hypothetical protein